MGTLAQKLKTREHRSRTVPKRIYDCAIDLFSSKGFDNVKVADICKAADVSTGTFYYYFPSKESIFFGYAEAIDDLMDDSIEELKGKTASETLKNLVLFKVRASIDSGADTSNVSFCAELKHHKDVALDIRRTAYGYYMNAIEQGIRSGEFRDDLNLYSATSVLRYMIGGLCLHWAIQPENVDIETESERLVNAFIDMLKPHQNG